MNPRLAFRKPYLQPKLMVYGNIQKLTRASGKLLALLDNGMGINIKTG